MITVKMFRIVLLALSLATLIAGYEKDKTTSQAKSCATYDGPNQGTPGPFQLNTTFTYYWSDRKLGGNRVAFDPSSSSIMMRTGQEARQDAVVSFYFYESADQGDVLVIYNYRIGRNDHCVVKIPQPGTVFQEDFRVQIGGFSSH